MYLIYFLIAGAEIPIRSCTAGGHHNVTELSLKGNSDTCGSPGGFQEVFISCSEVEKIEFIRNCDGEMQKNSGIHIYKCQNASLNVLKTDSKSYLTQKQKLITT